MAVRGIILDVDGTLVDSNDAHAKAWVDTLVEKGIKVPFDKVRRLIGKGSDKLLPEVSGISSDSAEGKALTKRRGEIFKTRYLPTLRPTPGAHDLLVHMHAQGLRLVVASSANKDELEPLLRICGGNQLIGERTSSDDADRSKPDPDIVEVALDEVGFAAVEVRMLGDTPYDVESSLRAGVAIIAFRCGGWKDLELRGALAVYDNPADLLAHYEQSPLGLTARA